MFYFVFEGKFQVQAPQGAYIRRGDLTEGFLRYDFGGLISGGAYTWRGLYSEFYGICLIRSVPILRSLASLSAWTSTDNVCSYFNKRCRCKPTHTDRRGLRVLSLKASILCLPHPRRETQRHSVGSGEKNGAREETSFQAQAKEPLGAFSPDPTD